MAEIFMFLINLVSDIVYNERWGYAIPASCLLLVLHSNWWDEFSVLQLQSMLHSDWARIPTQQPLQRPQSRATHYCQTQQYQGWSGCGMTYIVAVGTVGKCFSHYTVRSFSFNVSGQCLLCPMKLNYCSWMLQFERTKIIKL